jgi:uridine kinase
MPSLRTVVQPIWIGIQGGTCAGKSTLSRALAERLNSTSTLIINLDIFYHHTDRDSVSVPTQLNFDHPASVDWQLLRQTCEGLRIGNPVTLPAIDYVSGHRLPGPEVEPTKYIIIEGLWPFYDPYLFNLCALRVYVDAPADIRLVRRLRRDVLKGSRGWTVEEALLYYVQCTRPMHVGFVEPGLAVSHLAVSGEKSPQENADIVLQALRSIVD